ncbi:hypothetical protein [Tabrizicola thermarum]|uniref:hypothetical protein n=1 Tax=Tabrizicola thermarum TaxID=2670345 RepID=UPI000FFC6C05|nr:hypothetical protein [Tabrizicola thermarum]
MLRLLIGTGVLLMAVGFGSAGWQYWQSLPAAKAAAEDVAPAPPGPAAADVPAAAPAMRQVWLMSPVGDLIPQDEVRNYIAQDRFAPSRTVLVTRQARLADLLAAGESLPSADYLQVLADIRAPRVAAGLCEVLLRAMATDCAVNRARVVAGSVDPVAGTARFRLELAYRLPEQAEGLPDLAAHVFRTETVERTLEAGAEGTASAEAALATALATVTDACAARTDGKACRMLRLSLDWLPGQPVQARAEIGWLAPLPKGLFLAPPLAPASRG